MNKVARLHAASAVSSKGQTTIPKEVRDALGIKEGTPISWELENGVLTVRAKTRRLEDFIGILGAPPNGRHVAVDEMDEGIADAVADRRRAGPLA